MPYKITKNKNQYCVENSDTGERKGCSDSRDKATKHMRALYAAESEAAIAESLYEEAMAEMEYFDDVIEEDATFEDLAIEELQTKPGVKEYAWEGPIVFENVLTGDNRIFKPNSISWAEETLPWPFRWQRSSIEGHKGAIPIGRVDKLERKPDGTIFGYGVIIPSLNDEAAEYLRLMEAGVASGVSVDGDSAEFDVQELGAGKTKIEFSSMRLRSLTAVDIPAFNEARVGLSEVEDEEEMKKKRKKKVSWAYNLVAAAIPTKPPVEWFVDPEFSEPTPISVTEDGKVFGHLALFDTCHIGLPGCVTPPKGSTYKYFHTGEVETFEGDCVEVGHLTFNTGHAGLTDNAKQAAAHYDHTGAVAADVRAGEDKYGIWVSGALRSTLSDEDLRAFRAAPLSGDWRRIAGKLELVGALAVNVPGFPVPRARALVSSGHTESLITFAEDEEDMHSEYDLKLRREKKAQLAIQAQITLQSEEAEVLLDEEVHFDDLALDEEVEEFAERPKISVKEITDKAKTVKESDLAAGLKQLRELLDDPEDQEDILSAKDRAMFEDIYQGGLKMLKGKGKEGEKMEADVEEFHGTHNQASHGKGGGGGGGGSAPKGGGGGAPGIAKSAQAPGIAKAVGDKTKQYGAKIRRVGTPAEAEKLGNRHVNKALAYIAVGAIASFVVLAGVTTAPWTTTAVAVAATVAATRHTNKADAYARQADDLRSQGA